MKRQYKDKPPYRVFKDREEEKAFLRHWKKYHSRDWEQNLVLYKREYLRWNRKIFQYMLEWLRNPNLKYLLTVRDLVTRLNYGWDQGKRFIFFYNTPSALAFLDILKQQGYLLEYYHISREVVQVFKPSAVFEKDIVVIWLKPKEVLGNKRQPITWFSQNSYQYAFTYKQVLALTMVTHQTFIFNTVDGLVTQDYLLKKQIGGLLLCGLL